jgi:hypothetical protein
MSYIKLMTVQIFVLILVSLHVLNIYETHKPQNLYKSIFIHRKTLHALRSFLIHTLFYTKVTVITSFILSPLKSFETTDFFVTGITLNHWRIYHSIPFYVSIIREIWPTKPNFLRSVSHPWYSPASLPDGSGCWIRLIRKSVVAAG